MKKSPKLLNFCDNCGLKLTDEGCSEGHVVRKIEYLKSIKVKKSPKIRRVIIIPDMWVSSGSDVKRCVDNLMYANGSRNVEIRLVAEIRKRSAYDKT